MAEKGKCSYCGGKVESTKPDVDICRMCYYSGAHLSKRHADLIAKLNALPRGDVRADIEHTGGGCFGLGVTTMGAYYFATCAFKDEDGAWSFDVGTPEEPGQQWAVGAFTSRDANYEGEGEEIERIKLPVSDDEFVRMVAEGGFFSCGVCGKQGASPEAGAVNDGHPGYPAWRHGACVKEAK